MILGKWERERIVSWVKANSFKEEDEAIAKDEHELAERIRVSHNGGPEQCAIVDAAPPHFFGTSSTTYCSGGRSVHLRNYERYTRTPAESFNGPSWATEANAITQRRSVLTQKRHEIGVEISKALLVLRTTKKIREAMPEIAHMLPAEPVKGEMLPAVIIDVEAARKALFDSGAIKKAEADA